MKFVSSLQMKEIDRKATKKFDIPSLILMENAGRNIADESEKILRAKTGKVIIFCGYGNNGGDGFVAARHLVNKGHRVGVYLVGRPKAMSSDTRINLDILNKMGLRIKRITSQRQFTSLKKIINKAQIIIDAIFGIGIKGNLDDFYCKLIQMVNDSKVPVLSIDIPSGLDADKGIALPSAIKAKKTITMGLAKTGFLNPLAKKYLGKVVVADISLPQQLR